ncbi:TPA: ATP-binding protein [Burkholderia vietnamiensis]|nr:ATP-binding protein [Burkholderia vietnamiensis]HDR9216001.1 ATP-binding protein [Burkholderia vietnamiensis]
MLPENAAPLLAQAFGQILGKPELGSMAFVRCLPAEVTRGLAADTRFALPGWQIAAVVEINDVGQRWIAADRAVEWREDKAEPTLLLVDAAAAGAGMDGIYSAAREISEGELFDVALDLARQKLPHGYKIYAKRALDKARQVSRQRHLAPWRAFAYLCRAMFRVEDIGAALPLIGLWPVAIGDKAEEGDLDKAARLADRLLPVHGARLSAEQRVAALKLGKDESDVGQKLALFLREVESLPRLDALTRVEDKSEFWLNRLQPGLFDEQTLQTIEWLSWRGKTGKPQVWSGLQENDDRRLELRLNPNAENPKDRARMEVRWKTDPDTLPKGAVDFVIEVRSGHDVLAEKAVSHDGKSPQKVVFTQEDFADIEEDGRFEAQITIRAIGANPCEDAVSEDFVLCFGETDKPAKSSAGKLFPTLALAAAHVAPASDAFRQLARDPANRQLFGSDAKGFITCRWDGKVGKVFCPPLLSLLGNDWVNRGGALGRWRMVIRGDGTPVGATEFIEMSRDLGADRLADASRQMARWLSDTQGPLGVIYHHEGGEAINKYVLAAMEAWKGGIPRLTLIHTLEVVSQSGECLGLVVLPTHPLRVAWQQSFDSLVAYHRYEEGVPAAKVERLLEKVAGAHYPSFLPGLEAGKSFVFADTLGFHAVALVPADDPEPKATVALLGRLMGGDESAAPTIGKGASAALAGEMSRYLQLHPEYRRIKVHALRAGDAMPVARALGQATQSPLDEDELISGEHDQQLCYELDLYPASGQSTELTGRFLAATAERRRAGAGSVPEADRWMLDSVTRAGGVSLPRLRWARRREAMPSVPAHLAIAFDVFASRIECRRQSDLPENGVLEAHGLMLVPNREFKSTPIPHWVSYVPLSPDGEKHPVNGALTKRQIGLHAQILRATVEHLGGGAEDWPVLMTEVSPDQTDLLQELHGLCDWVITADRNAGIEYFDSPDDLPRVYESYIIDCVPERNDLGFMQLITSTSSFDEVVNLLDGGLGEMGLSASPRNCRFLLDALKAVSGRLALRLAGAGNAVQEMIALALAYSHCAKASEGEEIWLPLKEGFFIPLDDVPELFREPRTDAQGREQRADLLYVTAQKRGGLRLAVVEVKFRRYLKTARAPDLAQMIEEQVDASCQRWDQLFGAKTIALEKTVNRAWLARILRFYARKGRRHGLSVEAYANVMRETDRLVRKESDPPDLADLKRVGFIFCPEYGGRSPAHIEHGGETALWLFGPDILPEPHFDLQTTCEPLATVDSSPTGAPEEWQEMRAPHTGVAADETVVAGERAEMLTAQSVVDGRAEQVEAGVLLGHKEPGADPVVWRPVITSNPHLMILGLPGMGKTTSLINICEQLQADGITPIVFSYHQDIDGKLVNRLQQPPQLVQYAGLGFNPMEVTGDSSLAYLDNVGMIRDIFSAIFPDLGEVQLGRLREALKNSYLDTGWGPAGQKGEVPAFRAFLDILRADPKPDKGLLTRLAELEDYGFFENVTGASSLLETQALTLIQVHGTQNDYLQRAFATFVLYNVYQHMFRRGPQDRITHAIIFDEAHRAAKLKLIPTMVKECRKYGIAFVVASQEAKDFDPSLFTAVANYLALRLNEADAKLMAKNFAVSDKVGLYTDRIKQMPKYKAMYYGEGMRVPTVTVLLEDSEQRDRV